MNDQSKISVTLEDIPFADLHISDLNPRKVVNDTSIATLAKISAPTALFRTSHAFAMKQVLAWLLVAADIALLRYYNMIRDFNQLR